MPLQIQLSMNKTKLNYLKCQIKLLFNDFLNMFTLRDERC